MSVKLTSSASSSMEPLKKNRWIFQITEVPGAPSGADGLAFAAFAATVPKFTTNAIESDRINEKFYIAGKGTWNDLSVSFYDYIQSDSPGQSLYDWSQEVYDPITGQVGFKSSYSTTATLAHLDPQGAIVRMWNIFHMWPTEVDLGGSLSYTDDGIQEVVANFKFDYALKASDIVTTA